jgi:hypothetical protein
MKKVLLVTLPVAALVVAMGLSGKQQQQSGVSVTTESKATGVAASQVTAPPAAASGQNQGLEQQSLKDLVSRWNAAEDKIQLTAIADELAARNTTESVQLLVQALYTEQHWSTRAELAQSLRGVSNPDTLAVLLPELLTNHGRGSTVLSEIVDAVARMAQPDTVATLEVMHWQASTQAGQGHKVLRAVASIRNPSAKRALAKLAAHAESPALAAAAADAVSRM